MVQSSRVASRCLLSPSLRGSGLKSCGQTTYMILRPVSLFTREWIEITFQQHPTLQEVRSPSLRGSGLKYVIKTKK